MSWYNDAAHHTLPTWGRARLVVADSNTAAAAAVRPPETRLLDLVSALRTVGVVVRDDASVFAGLAELRALYERSPRPRRVTSD
jgi:hypothetical protein